MWSYFALNEVMKDPTSCNVFDWSVLEKVLDEAAVWGRQVAFRFYVEYPGGSGTHPGNGIPPCLNGKMALRTNGFWGTVSPDYDDPDVIAALTSFINAFAARYDRAGPGGTADPRIGFMSLGLVGLWGEWHTWPYDRDTGRRLPEPDADRRHHPHHHRRVRHRVQQHPARGALPPRGHRDRQHRVPRRLLAVQGVPRRPDQEHDPADVDERLGRTRSFSCSSTPAPRTGGSPSPSAARPGRRSRAASTPTGRAAPGRSTTCSPRPSSPTSPG